MESEVVRILLPADAREVREQILVHVCCEWLWCGPLVIHRRVECERLVNDIDDLYAHIICPVNHLLPSINLCLAIEDSRWT